MRVLTLVLVGLVLIPATAKAEPPDRRAAGHNSAVCKSAQKGLRWYVGWTKVWHQRTGAERWSVARRVQRALACPRYLAKVWRGKARAARRSFHRWFGQTYAKWRCIHEHEGRWDSDTGNGYYGGLQMDTSFYWGYGSEFARRWGHAGNWPVWAQLLAAERAYETRGFGPWPNTSRMCGL